MSIKIYSGLIATDKNPFIVQRRIKEVIEPLFFDRMDVAVAQARAAFNEGTGRRWDDVFHLSAGPRYDDWRGPIDKFDSNTSGKVYDLMKLLKSDPMRTFSELDFGYDVLLLPNGRGITIEPLVLVFSERAGSEYRKALVEAGVVREYGYWNNTDAPEELTSREWSQRKRAWDKLDVPASDGLSIAMPTRFDVWYRNTRSEGVAEPSPSC